jgi:hypothetical protein
MPVHDYKELGLKAKGAGYSKEGAEENTEIEVVRRRAEVEYNNLPVVGSSVNGKFRQTQVGDRQEG